MAKDEFDYSASLEHADELAEKIDFEEEDLAEGNDFSFALENVEMVKTRKGHPMLRLRGECIDAPHEGKRCFMNIVWPLFPGSGNSADQWRTLCRVCDYDPPATITEIPEEDLQGAFLGQAVVVAVSIDEGDEQYGRQNRYKVSKNQV